VVGTSGSCHFRCCKVLAGQAHKGAKSYAGAGEAELEGKETDGVVSESAKKRLAQ